MKYVALLRGINNADQRTDVAYLFNGIDAKGIIDLLPANREYIRFVHADGALIWNVYRKDYNRSRLNKIVSHKAYKDMTVRNVNTARYLASAMQAGTDPADGR